MARLWEPFSRSVTTSEALLVTVLLVFSVQKGVLGSPRRGSAHRPAGDFASSRRIIYFIFN
jgi:hypothetical protein